MFGEVGMVVGVAGDVLFDVDPGMRRLVLLVEVVVTEVAEETDPQGDRVATASGSRTRHIAGDGDGCHGEDRCERRQAAPRAWDEFLDVHVDPPFHMCPLLVLPRRPTTLPAVVGTPAIAPPSSVGAPVPPTLLSLRMTTEPPAASARAARPESHLSLRSFAQEPRPPPSRSPPCPASPL